MRTRSYLKMLPALLLALGILACSFTDRLLTVAVGTPTPAPTLIDVVAIQSTQTEIAARLTAASEAQAQQTAQAQQATQTQSATNLNATATHIVAVQTTAPPVIIPTDTPQTSAFNAVIQRLHQDGKVGSTGGRAYSLPDFEKNLAMLNNYGWFKTGHIANNFAIASDVTWSSASKSANWPWSGCGFVAGMQEQKEHLFTFLGLDGFAKIARQTANGPKYLASYKYGKLDIPDGSANIMLLVYNKHISFYVNDKVVSEATDNLYKEGPIYFAIFSGINKDYGTRCTFKDVNLFIFE